MCGDEHALLADPQWWMNTLIEWPAITSRLLPWLMALNNVTGMFFWAEDVWAPPDNEHIYPSGGMQRVAANGSGVAPAGAGADNIVGGVVWAEQTMLTNAPCASDGSPADGSNGDGSLMCK